MTSPLSWFTHLKEHLEQRGFVPSKIDQCLFINHDKKIFCLVYIDDMVWVADKMPASQKPLGTDKNGPEFAEQWSYSSVVGMLLYVAANSRSEIAYVVHQCARFTHNPKASHGAAVKQICLYLQGTKTKGLILKPSKQLTVDCFVDADFAGQWNVENPEDPLCVKSQTGYVLLVGNCPVHWASKLVK